MREVEFTAAAWERFWGRWAEQVERIPGGKEAMLERMGARLRNEVRGRIDRSGLHDARGRVKRWQNPHIGDKLGYVAVRPDSVEVAAGGGGTQRLNAGALTSFLEHGHRVRGRSGRYTARVMGYAFTLSAAARAEAIAVQEAQRLEELGGGLR